MPPAPPALRTPTAVQIAKAITAGTILLYVARELDAEMQHHRDADRDDARERRLR